MQTSADIAKQINPKLIVPFVNAVRGVFKTTFALDTTVHKPFVKQGAELTCDVSSIVVFHGALEGSVVVSLPMATAQSVASIFVRRPLTSTDPDFPDAIGELCNMITGAAKRQFTTASGMTVPRVIIGMDHRMTQLTDVPCVIIPCVCSVGEFRVEVSVKQAA